MEAINEMLLEEGIEFDPESGNYLDQHGTTIDFDIRKIVTDYLRHMQEYQRSNEVHQDFVNQPFDFDTVSQVRSVVSRRPMSSNVYSK